MPQAAAIADAASADPKAETRLLEQAKKVPLGELRDECARTKAATVDLEARRRKIHAGRFLRAHTDGEGAWNLRIRDNPEVGAEIMAALVPIRDRLFREARTQGRREPTEAYAADALLELARKRGGETKRSGTSTKILVRVDLDALLRGYPDGDEVCEIVGYGPVAVSAIRDLLDSGDPFLAAIATKGVDVVGVAHLGRRPTAHQQSALEWLYPMCANEACASSAFLENDHRLDWADSHVTGSTFSTGSAPTTTTSKPATTGPSWRARADGPSSRPAIHAIPSTPEGPRRPKRPDQLALSCARFRGGAALPVEAGPELAVALDARCDERVPTTRSG